MISQPSGDDAPAVDRSLSIFHTLNEEAAKVIEALKRLEIATMRVQSWTVDEAGDLERVTLRTLDRDGAASFHMISTFGIRDGSAFYQRWRVDPELGQPVRVTPPSDSAGAEKADPTASGP